MPSSISTVRLVGVPSSSIESEPRRTAMVPSSTTVTPLAATRWPIRPGEGGGLLAVEIAFEPVADGLVQHDARPAGAEHHVHFAGRRRHRLQIDQRLAHRFVDRVLPLVGDDEAFIAFAAAIAGAAGFLPVAVAGHDRDIDPHQRPDVAIGLAVAADDLHGLPGGAEADGNLADARVLGPRIGVDGLQQPHLGVEGGRRQRAVLAIELDVGARRRAGIVAGIAALDGAHGVGGPRNRLLRNVRGMRIADRLVLDGAQTEPLRGVVGRLLQPAVVEHQHFGLAVFEEQLAVVGAFEPAANDLGEPWTVETGAIDQRNGGRGYWVLQEFVF